MINPLSDLQFDSTERIGKVIDKVQWCKLREGFFQNALVMPAVSFSGFSSP